jgi:hypothetical protein
LPMGSSLGNQEVVTISDAPKSQKVAGFPVPDCVGILRADSVHKSAYVIARPRTVALLSNRPRL